MIKLLGVLIPVFSRERIWLPRYHTVSQRPSLQRRRILISALMTMNVAKTQLLLRWLCNLVQNVLSKNVPSEPWCVGLNFVI